jgi:hypothetical protein
VRGTKDIRARIAVKSMDPEIHKKWTGAARFAVYWVWSQTRHSFEMTTRLFPRSEVASIKLDDAA